MRDATLHAVVEAGVNDKVDEGAGDEQPPNNQRWKRTRLILMVSFR